MHSLTHSFIDSVLTHWASASSQVFSQVQEIQCWVKKDENFTWERGRDTFQWVTCCGDSTSYLSHALKALNEYYLWWVLANCSSEWEFKSHTIFNLPFPNTVKINVKMKFSRVPVCDSMDHNLPGLSVRGILQTRILKSVAIPFCRGSS